jgi:S1-C subfamily serine protease
MARAQVIGRDPGTDLALLRVDADLKAPTWLDAPASAGQLVLALGTSRSGAPQANLGMVSAVAGEWRTRGGGGIDHYIEVDGILRHGLSGGPLVDADGGVLGVNSHRLMRGGGTVPTATVRRVVEHLERHGGIKRGYLGVGAHPVELPEARASSLGRERGLLVASVAKGAPADSGGVLLGDVLLALDDVPLQSLEDLMAALADRPEKPVSLDILRAGERTTVAVELGTR